VESLSLDLTSLTDDPISGQISGLMPLPACQRDARGEQVLSNSRPGWTIMSSCSSSGEGLVVHEDEGDEERLDGELASESDDKSTTIVSTALAVAETLVFEIGSVMGEGEDLSSEFFLELVSGVKLEVESIPTSSLRAARPLPGLLVP